MNAITITVEIRPEVQAELARQTAAQGRALEAYAAGLLEDAAHVLAKGEEPRAAKATNLMELFEPVRGLLTDKEVDTLFGRSPSAADSRMNGLLLDTN